MEPILSVKDLSVSFNAFAGKVHAVRDVNFDLYKGETLAIVGESGSGKSVTTKAILGILAKNGHIDSGTIMYQGQDMAKYKEADFYKIRGKRISLVFQDPLSALNPIMKIGKQNKSPLPFQLAGFTAIFSFYKAVAVNDHYYDKKQYKHADNSYQAVHGHIPFPSFSFILPLSFTNCKTVCRP